MSPLRQLLVRSLLLLVAALVLVGFARTLRRETRPRADLVLGNGPEPRSLDPTQVSSKAEGRLLSFLYEGLTVSHPRTLEPLPALAERFEESDDGLSWTFHLRDAAVWGDGHPIVAADLRWSFLRLLDPATGADYASLLWCVDGAEAFTRSKPEGRKALRERVGIETQGARDLVFRLRRPAPWFASLTAFFPLYPVPRHLVERHGPAWTRQLPFVANGPYRLISRRLRDRMRLEVNPLHRDAAKLGIRSVDILVSDSLGTLLNLYMAGRADWIYDVPSAAIPALLRDHADAFQPFPYLGTYFYRLNTRKPPLDRPEIRQALGLALDREALVRDVTRCREPAATSFVPPLLPGYTPAKLAPENAERARELLREGLAAAGLDAMPTLELLYNNGEIHRRVAEAIQHRWREELGVSCRLVNMEWGAYKQALRSGSYTIARSSWLGDYLDATTFLNVFHSGSSNNQTGWADQDYDRLLAEAARCRDRKERATLLRRAEARLLESGAILPLFHDVTRALVRPDIEGFHPNLMDDHPPAFLKRRSPR